MSSPAPNAHGAVARTYAHASCAEDFQAVLRLVRGNMLPSLGAGLLTKLQPAQISEMYAKVLGSGRKDGTGGLSLASVLYMHRLLKQALAVAVTEWLLLP